MIKKIISGGQTGADRAALDVAIDLSIPHGGWCPRGRLAEDGVIPERYQVSETPTEDPVQRTEWNVRDSDGTVIFSIASSLTGSSARTEAFARQLHKPCIHISKERDGEIAPALLSRFLAENRVEVLNVAGARHSEEPDIAAFAIETLHAALVSKNTL